MVRFKLCRCSSLGINNHLISIGGNQMSKQLTLDLGTDAQATNNANKPNNVSRAQEIASAWVKYAHMNQIKNPKTRAYRWAQHAFLSGIGVALGEDTPMLISLCLASGRDVQSIIERTQPR